MNKKQLIAVLLISVAVSLSIVLPLTITNKVVSHNRGKEILQNRVEWSLQLSYELYNVNGTTLCGCNYTDSILMINASLSGWDNYSRYNIYFGNHSDSIWLGLYPFYPYVHKIRLNRTSLLTDSEISRHPFFNDWTEEYDVFLHERFSVDYKVIAWWHEVSFIEETQIGTFSISNLL